MPRVENEIKKSQALWPVYLKGVCQGRTPYDHGGYVNIPELPAGAAVRATRVADILEESGYLRVLSPPGGWMSADLLEKLADAADDLGEGIVHFSTGGSIELYAKREQLVPLTRRLNSFGLDVGSTGNDLRCITACAGPLRCEYALVDAPWLAAFLGMHFIDEQQFPGYGQKVKMGCSGCSFDCISAVKQKDLAVVGVYRGIPLVDEKLWEEWLRHGYSGSELESLCQHKAIKVEDDSLPTIDPDLCRSCMSCIRACWALCPGRERGVALWAGGKYGNRGRAGPMSGVRLLPFVPVSEKGLAKLTRVIEDLLELWADNCLRKERIGDFLSRVGREKVLESLGIKDSSGSGEEG